jgi:hypothetical protein
MNGRIWRKRARWRRPPFVRGPLTTEQAAGALPRILQRLTSRNEAWIVTGDLPSRGPCVLLSARYYTAVALAHPAHQTRGQDRRAP